MTTSACGVPFLLYIIATPAPLSCYPEGSVRTKRNPPGIYQIWVGKLSYTMDIRDEIRLPIEAPLMNIGYSWQYQHEHGYGKRRYSDQS